MNNIKKISIILLLISLSGCATWNGVKKDSNNAWKATKEGANEAYNSTKKAIHDMTSDDEEKSK